MPGHRRLSGHGPDRSSVIPPAPDGTGRTSHPRRDPAALEVRSGWRPEAGGAGAGRPAWPRGRKSLPDPGPIALLRVPVPAVA